jgi:peptide/nickel transport system substrate-binding protein
MHKRLWLSIAAAAVGVGLLIAATATAAPTKAASPAKGDKGSKGGTLVVEENTDIDYSDPSLSYYVPTWQLMYTTQCRLMYNPDAEAPKGSTVVPEVAAGLPVVSKDGKTYTFTIRKGYRFSNGQPVTAKNFKWAFDRVVDPKMASQVTPFIDGTLGAAIVGVSDVTSGKASSISGVIAKGNKLTLKLTQPAPDLLSRLTLPPFGAIDSTLAANRDPKGVNTFAGCGPYYFASRTPNKTITLKRNPYYKGPRPHSPDTIQVNVGNSLDVMYQNTVNGSTDFPDGIPASNWAGIFNQYGKNNQKGRLFTRPELEVDYVALNHDPGRLFHNNSQLAKAVNYSIDRHAFLAQRGALAGRTSSQILPPGMLGYKKLKLYPDTVTGASLAKAKQLAKGHTGNGKVVEWCSTSSLARNQCAVVQYNLQQLGLNVEPRFFPRAQQFSTAKIRAQADYDVTLEAWGADYPDPADFINVLLDGSVLAPTGNNNYSYYNNAKFNKQMHKAVLLVGAARGTAYAALDKAISTEDPPWASMLNRSGRFFVGAHYGCFVYQPAQQIADFAAACKK